MLNSLLLGLVLTIATVGIHAVGTTWWINHLRRKSGQFATSRHGWFLQLRLLASTAVTLLLLHIVEIATWASAYLWIQVETIKSIEEAIYFSAVTFTSLGYGDVVIAGKWRMLSAIESIVGLLIFGWSTALLITVVQRMWEIDRLPTKE